MENYYENDTRSDGELAEVYRILEVEEEPQGTAETETRGRLLRT